MSRTLIVLSTLTLGTVLSDQEAPPTSPPSTPPPRNRVLVVVAKAKDLDANHYLWAAEMAASRLKGDSNRVLEGGLAAAIKEAREHPGTVRGIVEIVVNVYSWDEDVRITCYDAGGRQLWKKKSSVNMGGSEEDLARKLVERTLVKAETMPACGRAG